MTPHTVTKVTRLSFPALSSPRKSELLLCRLQVSEAVTNMSRRPEEHMSFVENLELLKSHASMVVHTMRP
jgi:hypothetical protein